MKFSKIIGHDELKISLSKINGDPKSYLFYGPPSIGKRTIAHFLARYTLCQKLKEDECECPSCISFDNIHPDFLSLGENGKILVGDVDKLIDFVSRAPLCSETKIILIDNIDLITTEAANRLLKTIEESPFVFYMITSKYKDVFPTIRSRCVKIKFNALSQDDVVNILWKKMGFELPQARIIGWIGVGSGTDIFSCAGLYLKYRDMTFDFLNLFSGKDLLSILDFIDKVPRFDLPIFIDMVILVMSDMLILKSNYDSIINSDRRDDLQKMIKNCSEKALIISLSCLTQVKTYSYLNINLNLAFKSSTIKAWNIFQA
jgi:DNA polymerase-3 subunit delta'